MGLTLWPKLCCAKALHEWYFIGLQPLKLQATCCRARLQSEVSTFMWSRFHAFPALQLVNRFTWLIGYSVYKTIQIRRHMVKKRIVYKYCGIMYILMQSNMSSAQKSSAQCQLWQYNVCNRYFISYMVPYGTCSAPLSVAKAQKQLSSSPLEQKAAHSFITVIHLHSAIL